MFDAAEGEHERRHQYGIPLVRRPAHAARRRLLSVASDEGPINAPQLDPQWIIGGYTLLNRPHRLRHGEGRLGGSRSTPQPYEQVLLVPARCATTHRRRGCRAGRIRRAISGSQQLNEAVPNPLNKFYAPGNGVSRGRIRFMAQSRSSVSSQTRRVVKGEARRADHAGYLMFGLARRPGSDACRVQFTLTRLYK